MVIFVVKLQIYKLFYGFTLNNRMVTSGPVKLSVQTIFAIIPYVNIWAFYRIQKLRKFILLSLGIGFVFLPINFLVLRSLNMGDLNNPFDIYTNPIFISYLMSVIVVQLTLEVYFIRRWTKKWNKKFNK